MITKVIVNNDLIDFQEAKNNKIPITDKKVIYTCDRCGCEKEIAYLSLLSRKRLDIQYCRKCSIVVNDSVEKRKDTCLEKYGQDNPMKVSELIDKKVISSQDFIIDSRTNFQDIKKEFEKEGYNLLTTEYKNRTQKLEFICPNGHKYNISWASWFNGRRCKKCAIESQGEKLKYTIEEIREILARDNYTLLSDTYINKNVPIKYRCPRGHEGTVRFSNWISHNTRCSSCSHIRSRAELEIYDFCKKYFPNAELGNRTLISPQELDIYIQEKKLAIEYCGLFWHSEQQGKGKFYHLNKLNECLKKNIRLITIFEDEWLNKRNIVEAKLKSIFGVLDSERIYARNCIIKEIDYKTSSEFLNKYHIQGTDIPKLRLGAFLNDKLVSVMTFATPSLAKGGKNIEGVWELSRFCSHIDYHVIGIASKLFNYFCKNYNNTNIFSYADRRWSEGNLYYKLGFNFSHFSNPSYWYIVDYNRVHRFNFRKSQLLSKLEHFNNDLTEYRNMVNNGYDRVWDCGNIKFSLK